MQREINEKRQELLAKEESLRFVLIRKVVLSFLRDYAGTSRVDWQHRDPRATSVTSLWYVVGFRKFC